MKYMTSAEIRRMWLKFFKDHGHIVEEGASLIPVNDPTLLWINAGVAPLKKYFDGSEKPKSNRISNVQKALRTNDIENVGYTSRHHTFFEMLGNFSIGDYFKKEAITWGYELLTGKDWFAIDPDKLYMTVYPADKESKQIWMSCGVKEDHIIELEGNFWEIGEGPCGPDTEIFFDRGEKYDPDHLGIKLLKEDIDNDRYIEIWNIVLSQFNSKEGLKREEYPELPQKNIDTGGGLERFACIMQDGETNFDTDLFLPLIAEVEKLTKEKYRSDNIMTKRAFRVIADHIRTCTFAIADGAQFSNEGRGYVLRRVLRRAVRYGKKLGINESFLYKLVPTVANIMYDFYPYVSDKIDYIQKIIKTEEEKFQKTLTSGESMLVDYLKTCKGEVEGSVAFKLYDTYGFPYELTEEIAKEQGLNVDKDGFDKEMQEQKKRAKAAREKAQSMSSQSKDLLDFAGNSEFNYEPTPINAKAIALFKDGNRVKELNGVGAIVFDKTIFYAESGGQVADKGIIKNENVELEVYDVQKAPLKQHLHFVDTKGETISEGEEFSLSIDVERRNRITRSHSACHLLQQALIEVLGDHIAQAGSYVDDEKLRFDFTHFEKMSEEQIRRVEEIVNNHIDKSHPSTITYMPIEEAKKTGAIALFSEKYGDVVRVVNFDNYSVEFCGGSHVKNTNDIGVFVIESEESISSGVRRIVACTGINGYKLLKQREELLHTIQNKLGAMSYSETVDRLNAYIERNDALIKELNGIKVNMVNTSAVGMLANAKDHKEVKYLLTKVNDYDKDMLQTLIDALKNKLGENYFLFIVNASKDKCSLACAASKKAIELGLLAGKIIGPTAKMLGGGGGGRADFAQAGGKDTSKINEVLSYVEDIISKA